MTQSSNPSFFQDRKKHFVKEKKFLAERFGKLLISRLRNICKGNQDTILFIDAGTTLLPFFEILDQFAKKEEAVRKHLVVVTNNLAGIYWLTENGSLDENKELFLKCVALSGELLPKYNAVTGFEDSIGARFDRILFQLQTHNVIESIKNKRDAASRKINLVALVTGNWVRIRTTKEKPPIPIPLARGRGHLDVKESMIRNSDEVYVIAPLGKIFSGHNKSNVLKLLELYSDSYEELDTEKQVYEITTNNRTKIKLITTFRPDNTFLLHNSSNNIISELKRGETTQQNNNPPYVIEIDDKNINECKTNFEHYKIENIPHCLFKFKDVSSDGIIQLNEEFPHDYSSKEEFLKYFYITQ